MLNAHNDVMTLKQVADYFQVSQVTIHRLTQRGILPGVKIGRQWRYFRRSIEKILESSRATGKIGA
jgi:excisionase family DNA binding protein